MSLTDAQIEVSYVQRGGNFRCRICGKRFHSMHSARLHVRQHLKIEQRLRDKLEGL